MLLQSTSEQCRYNQQEQQDMGGSAGGLRRGHGHQRQRHGERAAALYPSHDSREEDGGRHCEHVLGMGKVRRRAGVPLLCLQVGH